MQETDERKKRIQVNCMAGIFFCFYKVVKSTWVQVEFHLIIYTTATVTS